MIQQGVFREDLFYRINTITIHLPPLRDRREDIPGLADFFIQQYSVKYNKPKIILSQKAQDALISYSWPGNIRELKHTIEKAIILCDSDKIEPADLSLKSHIASVGGTNGNQTLSESEKRAIEIALEKSKGNLSLAAKTLKISRTTLYAKIQKYKL